MKVTGQLPEKFLTLLNPETNTYLVSWGYCDAGEININTEEEPVMIKQSCFQQKSFSYKPNINEIKSLVLGYYNAECDKEILTGCTFEDVPVWLSKENQFNYKSAWDFASQTNGLNLPVVFKLGDEFNPVYREFKTVDDLKGFIVVIMGHITEKLNKYWKIKDDIDWSKYEI